MTRDALVQMQHLQKAVSAQIAAGTVTAAIQREASSLASAIIKLGSELRQQEKFYEKRAVELDEDQVEQVVTEWLSECTPSRRRRIAAAIAELEGKSTLLG